MKIAALGLVLWLSWLPAAALAVPGATGRNPGERLLLEGRYAESRVWFLENADRFPAESRDEVRQVVGYLDLVIWAQSHLRGRTGKGPVEVIFDTGSLSPQGAAEALAVAEAAHERISRTLALENPATIRVYLFPKAMEPDLWRAYPLLSRLNLPKGEVHAYWAGKDDHGPVAHEMVHALTNSWGVFAAGRKVPDLVIEGLAELAAETTWGVPLDAYVKRFRETGRFIPVTALLDDVEFRRANPVVAYEESGSFVEFLVADFGLEKLMEFYSRPSFFDTYGVSLGELEKRWLARVEQTPVTGEAARIADLRVDIGRIYATPGGLEQRPYLGVTVREEEGRVIVSQVREKSPAQRAGIREGDAVTALEGSPLAGIGAAGIAEALNKKKPGDRLVLTLARGGESLTRTVVLEARPGMEPR